MNTNEVLRPEDHARALSVAVGVATDDDQMIVQALLDAARDPRPQADGNVTIALGLAVVQLLAATIGEDEALRLLRQTLVQYRGAEGGSDE